MQAINEHHERCKAIQRRGVHDRIISKLQYWKELEVKGYDLKPRELAEVESLGVNLADVRDTMEAAGQPPGDYALLLALGVA